MLAKFCQSLAFTKQRVSLQTAQAGAISSVL